MILLNVTALLLEQLLASVGSNKILTQVLCQLIMDLDVTELAS